MAAPKFRNYSKPVHPTKLLGMVAAEHNLNERQRALLMSVPLRGTENWEARERVRQSLWDRENKRPVCRCFSWGEL